MQNGYLLPAFVRRFDCLVRRAPAGPCIAHPNARRAAATVGPMPTMPSSIVGPKQCNQRSLQKNS